MLLSKIQKELECMKSLDVIEKVSTPTLWVISMVTVEPNKTLHNYIDIIQLLRMPIFHADYVSYAKYIS